MYCGKSIAVVVPAYNEEEFVGEVIDSIPDFVDRLYVVDDHSQDDTWSEIERHVRIRNRERRSQDQPVVANDGYQEVANGGATQWAHSIRHEENTGVGGAIKTGYRRALEDEMSVIAVINGDGQMDPAILDKIIDPVVNGEAAYAKGNRLISPELRSGMTMWRFFGNAVLTLLTKFASGYWKVQDPQNGYTAISCEALSTIDIDTLYDRYGFVNDVLVKLNARGLPVADVEMEAVYGDEESDITYSSFVPGLSWLLCKNFLWRLKVRYLVLDFHPLVFFYFFGGLGIGTGSLLTVWTLVNGESSAVFAILSLVLLLYGSGFVLFAMVFDMLYNEQLEHQHYA